MANGWLLKSQRLINSIIHCAGDFSSTARIKKRCMDREQNIENCTVKLIYFFSMLVIQFHMV